MLLIQLLCLYHQETSIEELLDRFIYGHSKNDTKHILDQFRVQLPIFKSEVDEHRDKRSVRELGDCEFDSSGKVICCLGFVFFEFCQAYGYHREDAVDLRDQDANQLRY
jgi:hypothetical protein